MKISKLIKKLNKQLAVSGDIECVMIDDDGVVDCDAPELTGSQTIKSIEDLFIGICENGKKLLVIS